MPITTINRTTPPSIYQVGQDRKKAEKQQLLNKKIDTIHNNLRNSSLTNDTLNKYRDQLTRLGEKIKSKKLAFTPDERSLLHEKIVNTQKLINQTVKDPQAQSVEIDSPRSTDSSGYSSNSVDSALSTAHSLHSNPPVDRGDFLQNRVDEMFEELCTPSVTGNIIGREKTIVILNNLISNISREIHSTTPKENRIQKLNSILNSIKKFVKPTKNTDPSSRIAEEYRLMKQQIDNLQSYWR